MKQIIKNNDWNAIPRVLLSKNILPPIVELEISNINGVDATKERNGLFIRLFKIEKTDKDKKEAAPEKK